MEFAWLASEDDIFEVRKRDFRPLQIWHYDRIKEKSPIYVSEFAPHGGALKYTYKRTLCAKPLVGLKPKLVYIQPLFGLLKLL